MTAIKVPDPFHSEFKTDLDLERLPSRKFNTNHVILRLDMPAKAPNDNQPSDQTVNRFSEHNERLIVDDKP